MENKKKKKRNFTCPHCNGQLKANQKIILIAEDINHKRFIVLLSPKLGNYDIITHEGINPATEIMFVFCPMCAVSLASPTHTGLCTLHFDGGMIHFSPDREKQVTIIERKKKFQVYGKNAKDFTSSFPDIDKDFFFDVDNPRIMG